MLMKKHLLAFVGACLMLAMSLPSLAQSDVSDAELQQVAMVYVEISDIAQNAQLELQKAESDEQRQQIQKFANDKMVQVVQDSGLDVQEYNEIMASIKSDEKLYQRFTKALDGVRENHN